MAVLKVCENFILSFKDLDKARSNRVFLGCNNSFSLRIVFGRIFILAPKKFAESSIICFSII